MHVDDFIRTSNDTFKTQVIAKICDQFCISTQDDGSFKYLGSQIDQSRGRVQIYQIHYVESILGLEIECNCRKKDEPLSCVEKAFVGKLAWAANLTHPEITFETCEASVGNKLSIVSVACKANKALRKLKNSDVNVKFVPIRNLDGCKLVRYCDASCC